MRPFRASWSAVSLALLGCSSEPSEPSTTPAIDPAARAALAKLTFAESPALPLDVTNAWADSPDAAHFGRRLFFDPGFSGELLSGDNDGTPVAVGSRGDTGRVSCASCHLPESGFSDTRTIRQQVSLGAGWGLRRAPSLLDVGHSTLLMWDGRKDALYSQIFGVIESAVEMNSSRLYAAQHVFRTHRAEYEALFGPLPPLDDEARFPPLSALETGCHELKGEITCVGVQRGAPGDGAEFDGLSAEDQTAVTRVVVNVGKALGAYQRLLECGPSAFDRWMQGDPSAIDESAQRGAVLFVGKAGCVGCHSGPFLSDEKFHNVGLKPEVVATAFIDAGDVGAVKGIQLLHDDPLNVRGEFSDGDDGRVPESIGTELEGAFRTPKLRCVSSRPSFMHTAQLRTLESVVSFFDRGGDIGGYPGKKAIAALGLTLEERADLVAFLQTLEGPGAAAELRSAPE
jgi:cytochrome c peroxidase